MQCTGTGRVLIIILQVFMLLTVSTMSVAVAEESPQMPSLPLVIKGNVTIDGSQADPGTSITAKINDQIIGSVQTSNAGVYGDLSGNSLIVTAEPEDFKNIAIYVNGNEAEYDGDKLVNANPGDTIELDLTVKKDSMETFQDNSMFQFVLLGLIIIIAVFVALRYRSK
ncbi:hypothetical protein EFE40_04180 [Methanohalophilus halophilus]|nr:hypothetical protein EFE40_04180 [Methanohalophilus halophilus]